MRLRRVASVGWAAWAVCAAGVLGGCAGGLALQQAGPMRIESASTPAFLELAPRISVYTSSDLNTADVYITDLDPATVNALAQGQGVSRRGIVGQIVRVQMFLLPSAGRTPIDFTASNCTITHVVFVDGAVGVYGGGGFLLPSGRPGGPVFSGRMRDASLGPLGASDRFVDRLEVATLSGVISARRDVRMAAALERLVGDAQVRYVSAGPAR